MSTDKKTAPEGKMANKAKPIRKSPIATTRSLPARYAVGAWPAEMRADLVAAYLDFETTGLLMAAILRGEAPPPTAMRIHRGKQVPVWSGAACCTFIQYRHDLVPANDNRPLIEVELA
jgi:hypothetical protein